MEKKREKEEEKGKIKQVEFDYELSPELFEAASIGDVERVKALLEQPGVNSRGYEEKVSENRSVNAFLRACGGGHECCSSSTWISCFKGFVTQWI